MRNIININYRIGIYEGVGLNNILMKRGLIIIWSVTMVSMLLKI